MKCKNCNDGPDGFVKLCTEARKHDMLVKMLSSPSEAQPGRAGIQWQICREGETEPYLFLCHGYSDTIELAIQSELLILRLIRMGIKMYKTALFPYISGEQIVNGGKDIALTMSHVTLETIANEKTKQDKYILYFEGIEKGLVLNKTNVRAVINIVGSDDTDDWAGVKVSLTTEHGKWFGKESDAVRIIQAKVKS